MAGKTTAAYALLPEVLNVWEFVNADEMAGGLSPFKPDSVAFEAWRIMLQRIDLLMEKGVDFAIVLWVMKAGTTKPIPSSEEVLAGVRRAVQKVVEQAKHNDHELVIARDEKPVRVRARDL